MKVASKDLQDSCDGSAAAAPDAETVPGLINTLIDETQGSTLLEDAYGPELPGEVDPEKLPEVDPEKELSQLPDESEGGQGAAASSEKQGPKPKRKRLRDMTPESDSRRLWNCRPCRGPHRQATPKPAYTKQSLSSTALLG